MMSRHSLSMVAGLVVVLMGAGYGLAQPEIIINGERAGGGRVVVAPGGGGGVWAFGGGGANVEQLIMVITQLNMTPDFTLDKQAKQKLIDVRDEWRKAQAKFMEDNKDELKKLQQEQMAAYKSRDQDDIKLATQKFQEFYAKGPKGDEYVTRAKAALTPEQIKAVEERQAKMEEERKAMMERWQRNPGGNPGVTPLEKK